MKSVWKELSLGFERSKAVVSEGYAAVIIRVIYLMELDFHIVSLW